ncbi:MAG: Gfo/Idh/MocA family oxidoreductase [Ruminococcaceae bacterium]|nr:Gfo/Idh/MocA family oxidoreductase [Oscillospiraceae bacterium]
MPSSSAAKTWARWYSRSNKMRKIAIAQIGVGHDHAGALPPAFCALPERFTCVGYALPEGEAEKYPEKLGMFRGLREMTVEEILADPTIDAVAVETSEVHLTKYALLAAKAGKHIHMDKPGGANLPEFEELVDTVKKNGVILHLGYMYRYNPLIAPLMERIKSGEFGEIFNVEAQMNGISPPTREKRLWLDTIPGGMMFFLGCHMVDLVIEILGVPERIIPHNICTGIDGVRANDYGFAVFEYPNSKPRAQAFVKTCAQEFGGFARRQLVICGTKGTVEVKPLEMHVGSTGSQITEAVITTNPTWNDRGLTEKSEPYDRYSTMMDTFARMCLGEIGNPHSPEHELAVYKAVLQAAGMMEQ